jgi:hypothetical protein
MLIQLSPVAVTKLEGLMRRFGELRPEIMISRALGLLEVIQPYLAEDGTVTLVDPSKVTPGASSVSEDALVDIVFENARRDSSIRQPERV